MTGGAFFILTRPASLRSNKLEAFPISFIDESIHAEYTEGDIQAILTYRRIAQRRSSFLEREAGLTPENIREETHHELGSRKALHRF